MESKGIYRARRNNRAGGMVFVKGQVVESAVFLLAVVVALISLQTYLSRGLKDKYKESTDSLGGSQFSPRYSNYSLLRETIPFTSESTFTAADGMKETFKTNVITRTISAEVVPTAPVTAGLFFAEAPEELTAIFGGTTFATGYGLNNKKSFLDDFSNKKLIEDRLFPAPAESQELIIPVGGGIAGPEVNGGGGA
ncbi:MAG: hypothetical protein ABH858_02555 [Candidatus Omnitrophota bacterium]